VSEHQDFDVCLVLTNKLDEQKVSEAELRLISLFFSEILKEARIQVEMDKE
jgi:hypothetical protein